MDNLPLLIDTDPGVDDAWAILMAARRPGWQLQGLTVVGGNVGLEATCRNARILVDWLDLQVPVHAGAAQPLIGGASDAAHVHGRDGFGDASLPDPHAPMSSLPAPLAIIEQARRHAGRLQLLALGPLTNLALALRMEPRLPQWVDRLVVMGGALDGVGNLTPRAEFNFAFDPEAAEIVLRDWNQLELVDWSATLHCAPALAEVERMLAGGTAMASRMRRITRAVRGFLDAADASTWALADPLAAHLLLDHPPASGSAHSIQVLLDAGPRRGESVVAAISANRARVHVAQIDAHGFAQAAALALL